MAYYIVDGLPVFLYGRRLNQLREEAFKDKSASFRVGSMLSGSPDASEADKLLAETLAKKYEENQRSFYAGWVRFDLIGRAAKTAATDLLYDYCKYAGVGFLSDMRSFSQSLEDDYSGTSLAYPMGEVFHLNFRIRRPWWQSTTMSIPIACDDVLRLAGTMNDFLASGRHFDLRCGNTISIAVAASKTSEPVSQRDEDTHDYLFDWAAGLLTDPDCQAREKDEASMSV